MPLIAYKRKNFRAEARSMIAVANGILHEYERQGFDLTLRQLYYQFVARGFIANKQSEYNKLGNIVNDARLAGLIDWNHITDRMRNLRGRFQWHREGPAAAIAGAMDEYATDLWADQPTRVEVWIEKDALLGVIQNVCWELDVPYFSCRGYSSQSEMWLASQRMLKHLSAGQDVRVLHLGDHDPSGIDMTRDIEERLFLFLASDHYRRKMEGSGATAYASVDYVQEHFAVDRLALTMDQVQEHDPPPNPAKLTDSRANAYIEKYGDESWELDALPPDYMANLIREAVESYQDPDKWEEAMQREASHKELLSLVSERWEEVEEFVRG